MGLNPHIIFAELKQREMLEEASKTRQVNIARSAKRQTSIVEQIDHLVGLVIRR